VVCGEERKMRFLKNPRIALWILVVVICIALIGPKFDQRGILVTYVQKNATIDLRSGDIIYKINGSDAAPDMLKKEYYGIITLHTSIGVKTINANGSLGIFGKKLPPTNIRFGLDIEGGVRAVIQPEINESDILNITIEQIISTLRTRVNVYGLRDTKLRPLWYGNKGFVEISIAGGTPEELKELLERQGRFEAKVPIIYDLDDENASINLDNNYTISLYDDKIKIGDSIYNSGSKFVLDGIEFYVEKEGSKVNLTATVFTGKDIIIVYFDPQRSRIIPTEGGYNWMFQIQLTQEGAERFYKIARNLDTYFDIDSGKSYLKSKIAFYLDNELISELNIASDFKTKVIREPSIEGFEKTLEGAKNEMLRLQSILRSGSLPTSIKIVQMDTVSPNLGAGFLKTAAIAGVVAILAVVLIVFIRYRKVKIALPMLIVSFSELIIILGISVLIGWTIDLAAIAGIIAVIGTGIDSQIIILDEAIAGIKEFSLKEKIKRAFFIIFGSGGTTIAAMIPLSGIDLLRGFAIVTIAGVFVSIFVTRPAFGEIVKVILKE